MSVKVLDLGLVHYSKALKLQEIFVKLKDPWNTKMHENILILCEHLPVFTAGKRFNSFPNQEKLASFDKFLVGRGGQVTFHGPGQLVAYPILNLNKDFKKDLHWYVHSLEQVLIKTCSAFNVQAKENENVGVWVDNRKIGSIGIQLSKWISWHGVSLNVDMDLKPFELIQPCGLKDPITSLSKETCDKVEIQSVKTAFLDAFSQVFQVDSQLDQKETRF